MYKSEMYVNKNLIMSVNYTGAFPDRLQGYWPIHSDRGPSSQPVTDTVGLSVYQPAETKALNVVFKKAFWEIHLFRFLAELDDIPLQRLYSKYEATACSSRLA